MNSRFANIELLTVEEVASVLRVSKMTVYRKVHSGELESVHFGRSFRVPASAVQRYLATATGPSDAESGSPPNAAGSEGGAGARGG
ncbi:helix-turn-helix domain-containing protein [Arthrobacter pigmenti]